MRPPSLALSALHSHCPPTFLEMSRIAIVCVSKRKNPAVDYGPTGNANATSILWYKIGTCRQVGQIPR